jgi:hypothetical protein
MRKPRTDVCIFDKFIQRSWGHEQRYVCRIKDEKTRERRVAELMAQPYRACPLVKDVQENLRPDGIRPKLATIVNEAKLMDLRRFVLVALSRLAPPYTTDTDDVFWTLERVAGQLFRSDKPAKSDTPR